MKITRKQIKIKDIFNCYEDKKEEGVYGFGGLLSIRPAYQREFVYEPHKQKAVIDTIRRNLPLGVIYWGANEDGTFDVIDGQQRILSICNFMKKGGFHHRDERDTYHNMLDDEKERFNNYELDVYICEGSDIERLEWFRTINIASEPLTDQELRNANYVGSWLSDAKKNFSKVVGGNPCRGYNKSKHLNNDKHLLVNVKVNRQELLELALEWICTYKGVESIETYMGGHKDDANANELWLHYCQVIEWVESTFPKYHIEMKGVDWGRLYTEFGNNSYDTDELEKKILDLLGDEDVTSKKGVYEYVLSNCTRERVLSIRAFSKKDKQTKYAQQNGICPICGQHYEFDEMQGDHIVEWANNGKTILDNLQMVCHKCHKKLTNTMRD